MSKHQTIKMPNGISVCIETSTVQVNPFAFNDWPWSGKRWPNKTSTTQTYLFAFENVALDLVDISTESGDKANHDEAMFSAMATDCQTILNACMEGCGFALQAMLAVNPYEAEVKAKDAGYRSGENAAHWIAQESFGGRTRDRDMVPNAKRFLTMLDDGDPELMDGLPCSPLSGEYAGDVLPMDVMMDALDLNGNSLDSMKDAMESLDMMEAWSDFENTICTMYEDAHRERMLDVLASTAKGIMDNDNEQKANS
jgi:hypothetical protein